MRDALKQRLKRPLKRRLRPLLPLIQFLLWRQPNPIHLWRRDATFDVLWREIESYTLVEPAPAYVLYRAAQHARALPGVAAELGVYRGGTARLLARALGADKPLHLFDTFTGMVDTDPQRDRHRKGDFGDTSLVAVQHYLTDCPSAVFHAGLFPATAAALTGERFCLVHVDADIYPSVRAACEFFYSRLVPGGAMIFDDYGFLSCPGAREAVDEFFATTPETFLYLPTGQAVLFKHP